MRRKVESGKCPGVKLLPSGTGGPILPGDLGPIFINTDFSKNRADELGSLIFFARAENFCLRTPPLTLPNRPDLSHALSI